MIGYQLTDPSGNPTVSQENNTERDSDRLEMRISAWIDRWEEMEEREEENNTERDSFTPARMMSVWSEMLEDRIYRDLLDLAWEELQEQLDNTNNYPPAHDVPPVEQHPAEPTVEQADPINHQQQSVLQSGPEFSQAEPNIQIQQNNNERDSDSPAGPMISLQDMLEEYHNREIIVMPWELEDQIEDIDFYTPPDTPPPDDEPALEMVQIFNWIELYGDNPQVEPALSMEQHPAEPDVELAAPINHQQQSVQQSGPEFSQNELYNKKQMKNVPAAMHTRHLEVRLAPVGYFKGKMIYGAPGDQVPSPVNVNNSEFSHSKRKCESQQDDEKAYTSKPPNAFRPLRKSTRGGRKSPGSAPVNTKVKKKINNVPTAMHTRHLEERLAPVGLLKRKCESQQDDELAYINKPPNAFMIFMKEQRPYILARSKSTDSATVNTIIGKKWRALSDNEQEKYYQEAKTLRQLHKQLYPDWSAKDNYGQKQKRVRK